MASKKRKKKKEAKIEEEAKKAEEEIQEDGLIQVNAEENLEPSCGVSVWSKDKNDVAGMLVIQEKDNE